MPRPKYPLRYLKVKDSGYLKGVPNFGPNGSLKGMRRDFGWDDALPVKCGAYIYNCISRADIYRKARGR